MAMVLVAGLCSFFSDILTKGFKFDVLAGLTGVEGTFGLGVSWNLGSWTDFVTIGFGVNSFALLTVPGLGVDTVTGATTFAAVFALATSGAGFGRITTAGFTMGFKAGFAAGLATTRAAGFGSALATGFATGFKTGFVSGLATTFGLALPVTGCGFFGASLPTVAVFTFGSATFSAGLEDLVCPPLFGAFPAWTLPFGAAWAVFFATTVFPLGAAGFALALAAFTALGFGFAAVLPLTGAAFFAFTAGFEAGLGLAADTGLAFAFAFTGAFFATFFAAIALTGFALPVAAFFDFLLS